MLFNDTLFVGIDPTAGSRPMHYAALDRELRLVARDHGTLQEVLTFVGGLENAVVAIDAPQSPNRGLLLDPEIRRRYNLRPGGKTWGDWKLCEYELRRRNIRLYNTPRRAADAPGWMQVGFAIYRHLQSIGYGFFQVGQPAGRRTMLEVHPHACYASLLGRRPFLKATLEGRIQRQLVLHMEGVEVADPMRALEEITRHSILTGNLGMEELLDHDELDALAAAHTAYLAGVKAERVSQVGDVEEGQITVPTGELKDFYS